jgi:hypothetical protein
MFVKLTALPQTEGFSRYRRYLRPMTADLNWAIGGEAGDGIDSTGKIFAQALARAGRHVFTSKD